MMIKRKICIAVVVIVIVALIGGLFYLYKVNQYQSAVRGFTYQDIDISTVADGEYIGECDVDFIYAKVKVSVRDGQISDVKILEHRHDRGAAGEGITEKMMEEQKVDVDTVTGATNSSKVIKKAAERALLPNTSR